MGQFQVIQWDRDLSVAPWTAQTAWFASQMDVRRRQLIANLDGRTGVTLQAGAMLSMLVLCCRSLWVSTRMGHDAGKRCNE